ncbi:iron donor protein CyaY [Niveibacterium umoris]|uniref:Iron-sulfur cluster assembly protein CyaY n=1 Tax=Niveibacterium umoris TaxID=1193620 RepID=A0A840BLL5_9RHOO|nr:iron donor protein CyaY [Niveibacterium umoris]MBB4013344.1 CyaY protein [Niveibacterium umoris]
MDEAVFNPLAEQELVLIERAFDDAGMDVEVQPGNVLQIEFDDGSQMIINRHSAAREIWVAARLGGFHFRYDGRQWVGTRDGAELWTCLNRLASAQAGEPVSLVRGDAA